ncbi:MAG: hypothetical protein ACYSUX_11825 [Planctomycetota bacterium]|jgi:hypothetical protein
MTKKYTRFALAAAVYAAFAVYLYQPHFRGFDAIRLQDLFVLNVCLACLGCYLLSRRWVAGFAESFFAGAVYGFGPFVLGLAKFHPAAGFLAAAVPWLFCPAVFRSKIRGQKSEVRSQTLIFRLLFSVFRLPSSVFCLLPFLVIVLFFQLATRFGLDPIPITLKLRAADLAGLPAPLVAAKRNMTLVGFYHVPIAALVMGLCMFAAPFCFVSRASCPRFEGGTPSTQKAKRGGILQRGKILKDLAARRFGIVIIFAVATILAFCDSMFQVSPVIFLAISTLCCAVIIGAGIQGLISASRADKSPVLSAAILLGVLAIVTLLLATKCFQVAAGLADGYARLLVDTAKMYILGALAVAMRARNCGFTRSGRSCSTQQSRSIFFSARGLSSIRFNDLVLRAEFCVLRSTQYAERSTIR